MCIRDSFFFLMIRRPPRSTQSRSSAASDVYKRQVLTQSNGWDTSNEVNINATFTFLDSEETLLSPIITPRVSGNPIAGKIFLTPTNNLDSMQIKESTLSVAVDTTSTVSYTHLRAHETPEHLVCRLLLEKKKKKTQHKHFSQHQQQ
eukprot:TRINITY_DN3640_c0_g1_i2.p1 TRINITY_DN3640_c0_g1~~TRINITY_DN3640_c0_g1_i2.p1  ORF type:complete len:147 (+),score=83.20 TRINITY_DN3640_c0_g1_i2:66-506(+)